MNKSTPSILHNRLEWTNEAMTSANEKQLEKRLQRNPEIATHPIDDKGTTLLMYYALRGQDRVVRLLAKTSVLNAQDHRGWSAVHHAASRANLVCLKALLGANADASLVNETGATALHVLCQRFSLLGTLACVNVLLTVCDGAAKDQSGETVLSLTVGTKDFGPMRLAIASALLKHPQGEQCARMSNHQGKTPLMLACERGHVECVGLLRAYSDVSAVSKNGTGSDRGRDACGWALHGQTTGQQQTQSNAWDCITELANDLQPGRAAQLLRQAPKTLELELLRARAERDELEQTMTRPCVISPTRSGPKSHDLPITLTIAASDTEKAKTSSRLRRL